MKGFLTYMTEAKATNEQLDSVMQILNKEKYNWKRTSATGAIFKVFTKRPRMEIVQELLGLFHDSYISPKKETIVLIKGTNIQLVVKPEGRSGVKSAGLESEAAFVSDINKICQDNQKNKGVNIRFIGSNGVNFECRGVKSAIGTGLDTSNRKKADVILHGDRDYPISLKKRNAEYWESADSYAGELARKLIDKAIEEGKTQLVSVGHGEALKLTKELVYKATKSQTRQVVFGSDILGRGCVIQETFMGNLPYTVTEDDWIEIKVSKIFKKISDVENDPTHAVWFLIRNDRTRNSKTIGYRGLRVLAAYASRTKGKTVVSQG